MGESVVAYGIEGILPASKLCLGKDACELEAVVIIVAFTQMIMIILLYRLFVSISKIKGGSAEIKELEGQVTSHVLALMKQLEEDNMSFITYLSQYKEEIQQIKDDVEERIHQEGTPKGNVPLEKEEKEEKEREVFRPGKKVKLTPAANLSGGVGVEMPLYIQAKILQEQGYSIKEIAKKLNKGTVEIDLLLKLRQK